VIIPVAADKDPACTTGKESRRPIRLSQRIKSGVIMTIPNTRGYDIQKMILESARMFAKAGEDNSCCPRCGKIPKVAVPWDGPWTCEMCRFEYHLKTTTGTLPEIPETQIRMKETSGEGFIRCPRCGTDPGLNFPYEGSWTCESCGHVYRIQRIR
jgi:uncharacterized C2H2 Zn-finger protein